MPQPKPLDIHQQELINTVKAAHQTLALARKTRTTELARRMAMDKIRLQREAEEAELRIKMVLDAEVAVHETNLDEALIAAYNNSVPIRRIAIDGFGNRYDGGVQQLLVKLRDDGRLGNREGYRRNASDEDRSTVAFPKPIDVEGILSESTTLSAPRFTAMPTPLVLVPADENGNDGITAPAVNLELDSRDPWFARIQGNARPGTPFLRATFATLYEHPATGELMALESKETGDLIWDHPVARWVKEHPEQAREGFDAALGEQLGIRGPGASL